MTGRRIEPSLLVIAAGVTAAIHVAKLPPALPALREQHGIPLVQAGFLISLVQLAGMSLGLFVGLAADAIGLRRTLLAGLTVVSAASALAGLADRAWMLLVLRAVEGLGFLLAVMPAPGLVRRLVPPQRLSPRLGLWGSYMPFGSALALLAGPAWIGTLGWPSWWWLASALSTLAIVAVLTGVPADPRASGTGGASGALWPRLAQTLRAPGPWLVSLAFAAYSGQWLAVIGFLPTVYAQAGLSPSLAGAATALVAGSNMIGNIASGRLLQRGWPPQVLLRIGFATMAFGGLLAFVPVSGAAALWPYAAVLCFSAVGGLIPGTLFSLSVRLAPAPGTVSTTVGWMQQWSAFGQFAGPPLVAWVASRAGSWAFSGVVTASCAAAGLLLAGAIGRLCRRAPAAAA